MKLIPTNSTSNFFNQLHFDSLQSWRGRTIDVITNISKQIQKNPKLFTIVLAVSVIFLCAIKILMRSSKLSNKKVEKHQQENNKESQVQKKDETISTTDPQKAVGEDSNSSAGGEGKKTKKVKIVIIKPDDNFKTPLKKWEEKLDKRLSDARLTASLKKRAELEKSGSLNIPDDSLNPSNLSLTPPPPPPPMTPPPPAPGESNINLKAPKKEEEPRFEGEIDEPLIRINESGYINLALLSKEVIQKQFDEIANYCETLKKVIDGVKKDILKKQEFQDRLKTLHERKLMAEGERKTLSTRLKILSEPSDVSFLYLKQNAKVVRIPIYSQARLDEINQALTKRGFATLNPNYQKSTHLYSIKEELAGVDGELAEIKLTIASTIKEMNDFLERQNNGISFKDLEKVLSSKQSKIDKWELAQKKHRAHLDKFSIDEKSKLATPLTTTKKYTMKDFVNENPDLELNYWLDSQTDPTLYQQLQIIERATPKDFISQLYGKE